MALNVAPGFIDVESRSLGTGVASLSTEHINTISPTKIRQDERAQCIVTMDGGQEVVLFQSREQVVQIIAEAVGAAEIGAGAIYEQLSKQLKANTRLLIAAVQQNPLPSQ